MLNFTMGGRHIDPDRLAEGVMRGAAADLARQLRERFGSIRHPDTGEFARVVIPLSLTEVRRLEPLMFGDAARSTDARPLRVACKFYLQAVRAATVDVEVAYLHLITAGEVLSSLVEVAEERLVDAATRSRLDALRDVVGGEGYERFVRSRLRCVKRRFVCALADLVDDRLFASCEAPLEFPRLRRDGLVRTLSAAYDLRSRYVHIGRDFGT